MCAWICIAHNSLRTPNALDALVSREKYVLSRRLKQSVLLDGSGIKSESESSFSCWPSGQQQQLKMPDGRTC